MRRVLPLGIAGVLVLGGALLVGLLPDRVDGGIEPAVRRVLDWLQILGAPGWVNYDLADFVGNVLFFIPIGLLAALLLPWRVWWLAIPLGAALSGALELGQLLFLPDRYASATDVAANTAGTVLGALIGAALRAAVRRRGAVSPRRAASPPPARPAARR